MDIKRIKFARGLAQWNHEAAIAYCREHQQPLVLADVPKVNPDPKWSETKVKVFNLLANRPMTLREFCHVAPLKRVSKVLNELQEDGLCIEYQGRYTLRQLSAVAAYLLDNEQCPDWIKPLLEKRMLHEYIETKKQLAELELRLKALKESAIQEALDLLNDCQGQTFFYDGTKVTVRFVPKKPKPNHPLLEGLHTVIEQERNKLAEANSEALAALRKKRAELEKQLQALEQEEQALLTSETVQMLQSEYDAKVKELSEVEPVLVIG